MLLAASHAVFATADVGRITRFFESVFDIAPHFENSEFSEFVLPSRFRIAFFRPVGKAKMSFRESGERAAQAVGLTVNGVEALYQRVIDRTDCQTSGPPKDHPWGEKSFLLVDPDGNRWEIAESPSKDGMLISKS